MKHAGHQNDFDRTLEATRREREEIEAQLASLTSRRDALLRREERLRVEAETRNPEPVLVRAEWLVENLGMSRDALERLRRNKAKGFPTAIYGLDAFPRWNWSEVKDWIEEQRQ